MLPAGDTRMEWRQRLVGTELDGQFRSCEVMAINRLMVLMTSPALSAAAAKRPGRFRAQLRFGGQLTVSRHGR
jgi:hypothetical protein